MEEIEITIVNWEKFNGRKDIKHPSWFRMENRIYSSESLFGLNSSERWVWVCLLSICNQRAGGTIRCGKKWLLHETDLQECELDGALNKLAENGSVRTRTCPNVHVTRQTDIQTDTTTLQTAAVGNVVIGKDTIPEKTLQTWAIKYNKEMGDGWLDAALDSVMTELSCDSSETPHNFKKLPLVVRVNKMLEVRAKKEKKSQSRDTVERADV